MGEECQHGSKTSRNTNLVHGYQRRSNLIHGISEITTKSRLGFNKWILEMDMRSRLDFDLWIPGMGTGLHRSRLGPV